MTYIANITDSSWNMVIEQAFIPADQEQADFLCEAGHLTKYDETTEPRPSKKVYIYETGKSYPADVLILRNDSLYLSNTITSNTWIETEYDIKITGSDLQ